MMLKEQQESFRRENYTETGSEYRNTGTVGSKLLSIPIQGAEVSKWMEASLRLHENED